VFDRGRRSRHLWRSVLHSARRCHAPCLEAAQRSRSACSPVPCTPPAVTIQIKETVCRHIRLFSVNVIVCLCRTLLSCSSRLYRCRCVYCCKRRSRFLCNLDCVLFFQNYSFLHFSLCSFFLTFISRAMSFFCILCLFIFVLVVLQLFCE